MTTKKHTVRLTIPSLHEKPADWLPACIYAWADRWGWATELRIRRTATALEIEGAERSITAEEWERTWGIVLREDTWATLVEYGVRLIGLGRATTATVKTWGADGLREEEIETVCVEVPFAPALGYGWDWQPIPVAKADGPSWLNEPRRGQREKPWERLDQAISPVIFAKALGFQTFAFPGEEETIIFDTAGLYAGAVRSGDFTETNGLAEELEDAEARLEAARQRARAQATHRHEQLFPNSERLSKWRLDDAELVGTRDERETVEKLKARIAESDYSAEFFFPKPNGARAFGLDSDSRAVGSHDMLTALVGDNRSTAAKLAARYRENAQPLVAWLYSQRNQQQPAIEAAAERLIALPRPKKNTRPVKNTPFTGQDAETFRTILTACGGDVERAMKVVATIAKEMNR